MTLHMEESKMDCNVSRARYISVNPKKLKEVATRMEFEASDAAKTKSKITYALTEDLVLFFDPSGE